jgi:hypothetical protein
MITFRGKRIDNGSMAYSSAIRHWDGNVFFFIRTSELKIHNWHLIESETIQFKVGERWFQLSEFENMCKESKQYKNK